MKCKLSLFFNEAKFDLKNFKTIKFKASNYDLKFVFLNAIFYSLVTKKNLLYNLLCLLPTQLPLYTTCCDHQLTGSSKLGYYLRSKNLNIILILKFDLRCANKSFDSKSIIKEGLNGSK